MCGIAGVIRREGSTSLPGLVSLVEAMLSRLRHRGRQDGKVLQVETGCLGCCRLPVVDREHGPQPMTNEDGSVFAVFNGEIYNHVDLYSTLVSERHTPASDCDSDLIVHLYEHSERIPSNMHADMRGMYAMAIFDAEQKQWVLLRDPVGKKPLYVLETDTLVAFASELKAFGLPTELPDFGSNPRIWELKPGGTAIFKDGNVEMTFQTPPWKSHNRSAITDMEDAARQLRSIVEEAVEIRVPRDLPVAVLCSGGIDSVIVAHLAKKFSLRKNAKLKAYVIGAPNSPDVRAATATCERLQISLEKLPLDETLLHSIVGEVVYHTESFEPNIVRNSLLSYMLFKRIRNNDYRVALCGEGADELFFGYADFENLPSPEGLMSDLMDDLHRTQLLRVDRTSMAFSVETRVPFLDRKVVELACAIAPQLKGTSIYGQWQGKAVLRQAFKDVLPWEIITRMKATLSYGAGFGDVSMSGHNPLEDYAKKVLRNEEKSRLEKAYPQLGMLSTFERALYLYYYEQFYKVPDNYIPPVVAKKEIREAEERTTVA